MFYENSGKAFESEEHCKRLADALRRRLHPNTALRDVDLAHAIGMSVETIRNWRTGCSDPSSYRLGLLMKFFTWQNDFTFWSEVYGPIGQQMRERFTARERERRAEEEEERRHIELLAGTGDR